MNCCRRPSFLTLALCLASAHAAVARDFNVRAAGALGDGKTLDTVAINETIDACAAAGGGRVVVPPGKYLTGTIRLKSNVTLVLKDAAELVGVTDLDRYGHFTPPANTPLVGGSARWHRALVLGVDVENVAIVGRGVIDGNNVADKLGEEGVRGPHAVLFGNSKNVTIRDVTVRNAGNYAALFEFSSNITVRGVTITGGYDGVHLRGWAGAPCRDVRITDCEIYTGDDCIAGWHWDDVLIDRCVLNSACNGIRLFGPARRVIVHNSLFVGPAKHPWRTAGLLNLRNMASGICIQPSAWGETPGTVDDVRVASVTMHDVAAPLHVIAKPPSTIGRVSVDRLTATGVYRAAASFESWTNEPIGRVDLRDASISYVGGPPPLSNPLEVGRALLAAKSPADVRPPGIDARPLPAWGLYARNVKALNLADVHLSAENDDARPAVLLDGVDTLHATDLRPVGRSTLRNVRRVIRDEPPSR